MRNRPVERDEVRFNGHAITTAPIDAVAGPYDWAVPTRPPPEAFAPLWELLTAMLGVPMPPSWELCEAGPCHECGRKYWSNYRSRGFFLLGSLRQPRPPGPVSHNPRRKAGNGTSRTLLRMVWCTDQGREIDQTLLLVGTPHRGASC